jgi:RND family efflux transporter MFP subunit
MKTTTPSWLLSLATLLSLTMLPGCGAPPEDAPAETSRPVKSLVITGAGEGGIRYFPGRIDSANKAELSFRVAGKIESFEVSEGEEVVEGQLLAQLDQTDYAIAVNDKQATYDRTRNNFQRAEQLIESGNISQRDYDTINSNMKSARAALELAQQNLKYTSLKAPFAGSIAKRHVEAFEEVQAKVTVLSLIDQHSLDVKFDLPENLILQLPKGASNEKGVEKVGVTASFEGSDKVFPLVFREVSKRADPNTQTFEVTYSIPEQEDMIILPGMTANVEVDFSRVVNVKALHHIPIKALTANTGLEALVWRIDEETMTVHEQRVSVGRVLGSSVEVTAGLQGGTRIVTAGAAYLAEGMKVTLLEEVEQAEARSEQFPSTRQQ